MHKPISEHFEHTHAETLTHGARRRCRAHAIDVRFVNKAELEQHRQRQQSQIHHRHRQSSASAAVARFSSRETAICARMRKPSLLCSSTQRWIIHFLFSFFLLAKRSSGPSSSSCVRCSFASGRQQQNHRTKADRKNVCLCFVARFVSFRFSPPHTRRTQRAYTEMPERSMRAKE